MTGSAYDIFLSRSLEHAELVRAPTIDASFEMFVDLKLEAYACLRTRLDEDAVKMPGCTILDGGFVSTNDEICIKKRGIVHQKRGILH